MTVTAQEYAVLALWAREPYPEAMLPALSLVAVALLLGHVSGWDWRFWVGAGVVMVAVSLVIIAVS